MQNKEIAMPRKSTFWKKVLIFLAVLGPGIITGSVDNDVGGITTYSVAGATYGYNMLWTLVPAFIVLIVVQEMNARMGIVTGKGLADLIRENARVKLTFVIFIALLIADLLNTATEFAGVAGSMQIFSVNKYVAVPIVAFVIWVMVVKGTYKMAERIFLIFSAALLSYVISAVLAGPDWPSIGHAMVSPEIKGDYSWTTMVIGIIGTTIAPWMQFYMQSAVIEKKLTIKQYKYTVMDVVIGSVATIVVAFFIMIACASTLFVHGQQITDAADAAGALAPLAGNLASLIFAFGLFIAAVFSATILPVATAFYVCEAFGFEAGIDKKWKEAPQFYWLYTFIILIGAGIILIPNSPLVEISLWSQRINGILLPIVLVSMMLIINKKSVMGKHTNKLFQNIIGWLTIIILVGLSLFMVFSLLFIK
jgi:Mn2+/Fe2+ NRAMP family transporter